MKRDMKENRKKPELLIPAKNLEVLRTAVRFGADAVYIGGDVYGLRAKAENFSPEQMKEGIDYAHRFGKQVYVTVNILAHNADMPGIRAYLEELKILAPDGLIIADPAVFMAAKEICPEIDRHISTQANNTNYGTFRFWNELGASRVVTARELSLEEIREIRGHIPAEMEIETFVHGAMCISYSGRCLMSNYFTGRDANQGECTHPCRWNYAVVEETRPGEYLPVYENERGTFLFNSKDLCMIDHIPDLVEAGIDSFKVEGRMKNALYVANVARIYRMAIDDWFEDPALYESKKNWYVEQVGMGTVRLFTTGFFYGKPDSSAQIYKESTYYRRATFLGVAEQVSKDGSFWLTQKNKFSVGEELVIVRPNGDDEKVTVLSIADESLTPMESASHAKQRVCVKLTAVPCEGDLLRRDEE